ncbi:hypothetical protein [Prosthecodimorpha staleyi]|uniref:Uncharacterized protein n=1 Tax=Prosthecodimorpha staleyi TaxID=2840188 RepID=A0A947GJR3_9HYPH|nr:hypothetical protein [Prosthecodimorpha staleyi]MBT9292189.1 hypothetical protein [Prosthecodimorpha staleyi]
MPFDFSPDIVLADQAERLKSLQPGCGDCAPVFDSKAFTDAPITMLGIGDVRKKSAGPAFSQTLQQYGIRSNRHRNDRIMEDMDRSALIGTCLSRSGEK